MKDHIYKKIEITGTSTESMEKAIQNAIQKASSSVREMKWFEMVEARGNIQGDQVDQWQVTVKIGFRLDG